MEAFSDGVLAIAITLLVLNLHVPTATPRLTLAHQLHEEWPAFVAYVISFVTIGIIWINHHAMVRRLKAVDHTLLTLNLGLLLTVGILPFTTALIAAYVKQRHGEHLAAAVYAGSLLLMSIAFLTTHRYILRRTSQLLAHDMDEATRRSILARNAVGLAPYAVAVGLAFISSYAALVLCGLVAAFYAWPHTTAG